METVVVKKENGIATIILNRPERLNALTEQLVGDLAEAIEDAGRDDEVRAVVLTGAGRAFCAGADFRYSAMRSGEVTVKEAHELGVGGKVRYRKERQGRLHSQMCKKVMLELIDLDKPTIAMINGDAVGGGVELILACDLAMASEQARFGVGFTRIGLSPGQGMTWLLPRIVGPRQALEFILLADFWSAQDAYRIGLVNRVFSADKLESETMAMARKLAEGPPIALRLSKLQVYNGLRMDVDVATTFARASEMIVLMSDDHREGIEAFAQKRKPIYKDR